MGSVCSVSGRTHLVGNLQGTVIGLLGKEEAAGYVIKLVQQQFASGRVAFGCKVKETKKACKGMQHGLVTGISRSPGFASTGLAVGPIGEDPAVLSGTARVQAGGTHLEAATGFPAVNDLMRVEDAGGPPKNGANPTAEQVTVNPV